MYRRVLLTAAAFLSSALPAAAQTATATPSDNASGPSLLWVWVMILVLGVPIFIVGTSMGQRRR